MLELCLLAQFAVESPERHVAVVLGQSSLTSSEGHWDLSKESGWG